MPESMAATEVHAKSYQLFGRQSSDEPLRYIETINIAAGETLDDARTPDADGTWLELIAVPETSLVCVIGEGRPQ